LARQGNSYWAENPEKRLHPEGVPYYWLGGKWNILEEELHSDVALLEEGYITAVPIHITQLTDHGVFQSQKHLMEQLFNSDQKAALPSE